MHRVLGHPGEEGMAWHRQHTIGAHYSNLDASTPRPICAACVQGTMRQTSTDHLRIHRPPSPCYGSQFTLDAYTHTHRSQAGYKYCDIITDLSTRRSYPCFTKDRGAAELVKSFSTLFQSHPDWKPSLPGVDRFIRADAEKSYRSAEFLQCLHTFGYRLEPTPPRDKHANGVAERAVGVLSMKCNIIMHPLGMTVPQKFWDLAFEYTCITHAFNYHSAIKTSPYHLITGQHVILKNLKSFWSLCWVHIALEDRKGKIGFPRAYKARFVGYDLSRTLEPSFKVIEILPTGIYGKIRTSKDVIFDKDNNYKNTDEYPTDLDFDQLYQNSNIDISMVPPANNTVEKDSELEIATSAIPMHPVPVQTCIPQNQLIQNPNSAKRNPIKNNNKSGSKNVKSTKHKAVSLDPTPVTIPPHTISDIDASNIGINTPITNIENDDCVYWYSTRIRNHEHFLSIIEASHHDKLFIDFDTLNVPKTFWKAMAIPEWAAAIDTELKKFEKNECLHLVPYIDQHLVPMMWLFSIKTNGTKKARLVGRGDKMIPLVDFDPDAVYCGNVSSCSIKMALSIAAAYGLVMRGGDLIGAYLITRANVNFPVHIETPQGYTCPPGFCFQAVGNLYGFPPAGQNFSIEFDKCILECGYKNTPWDLKLFYKWTTDGRPMLIIVHSDDFRWFGPSDKLDEWDLILATFNEHKYEVTDATENEFVGIRIQRDEDGTYYMDQHRMIDSIIHEANMTGAKNMHLPYPTGDQEPPLSKKDNASSPEERTQCSKYPYRRVVGQLMYGMVHTMVGILYALNILSRYGNDPGPRHIKFLKHLLQYVKYASRDRLVFHGHDGPRDIETMTSLLQLRFQCDADLGGNLDNSHSQTAYLGYLGRNLICWCSTDQGSISTSTAESEIKAVNHTLKAEVIANRGILNMMGWVQGPTPIEEDNQACIYHSKATHMTRNLRHLDLTENWVKEKVADGTCVVIKVKSCDNNSDIGTKRVSLPIFNKLLNPIIDQSQRRNL